MKRLIVAVGLALLSVPATARGQASAADADTVYHGRPLSAWILDLKAPAPQSRNGAAYAIGSMGAAAKAAVPALIEALSDPNAAVRYPVCVALREIGPPAADALPKLEEVLDDQNDDVAFMAKKAIIAISGKPPAP